MLFCVLLADKEVNSAARHETLACPCNGGGNHSVSKRLVKCTFCRKSMWVELFNLKNLSSVNSGNFDAHELSF